MSSKLFVSFLALTIICTTPAALAAPLQCSDRAILDFVNTGLKTNATWGDNGKPANSKGPLQIVGIPRSVSSTKRTLICDVQVRHTDPTNGAVEFLTARLTVHLRSNGAILNAGMIFLESSR